MIGTHWHLRRLSWPALLVVAGCALPAAAPTSSPTPTATPGAYLSFGATLGATATASATSGQPSAAASTGGTAFAQSTANAHQAQAQPPAGSCHARGTGDYTLPDPACTPGALNPTVTQATLSTTVCRSGYSSRIRPASSITGREKRSSLLSYGDTGPVSSYEYDHLISLELGGAANDARNLWPEPGSSPNPKDRLENRLHSLVCSHRLSLADAQREIAVDWVATYRSDFG